MFAATTVQHAHLSELMRSKSFRQSFKSGFTALAHLKAWTITLLGPPANRLPVEG